MPIPSTLSRLALDIKLTHTVFALPFAVLAAFLVAPGADGRILWTGFAGSLALVVLCMFLARTWAMLVNRLADREIDAGNPRTRGRAFASGELSVRFGRAMLAASAAGFVLACAGFWIVDSNPWPVALSVPVLAWIAFYSFTKRFTWLCHVFLGGALAASPLAAALAIAGPGLFTHPERGALLAIALMVGLWVAGFDIIYALQDLDFDRAEGLESVPARFGWTRAAWISRALHLAALAALGWAWSASPALGPGFLAGVALVAGVLVWEHIVLSRRGLAGIPMAFFTLNGVVSLVLGAAGVLDVLRL